MLKRMVLIIIFSLVNGCAQAVEVVIGNALVDKDVVTINVIIKNVKDIPFYIHGSNICTLEPLDKNLFSIKKITEKKEVLFLGLLHDAEVGFIPVVKGSPLKCKVRLNFSYEFPDERGQQYSVQYIVQNPVFNEQNDIQLKSNKVLFTY